jgi:hypothetical protein
MATLVTPQGDAVFEEVSAPVINHDDYLYGEDFIQVCYCSVRTRTYLEGMLLTDPVFSLLVQLEQRHFARRSLVFSIRQESWSAVLFLDDLERENLPPDTTVLAARCRSGGIVPLL